MNKIQTMQKHSVSDQISLLEPLLNELLKAETIKEKLRILSSQPSVYDFLKKKAALQSAYKNLDFYLKYIFLSLLAIGQGLIIFQNFDKIKNEVQALHEFLENLSLLEKFYENIGGLIGYHLKVLKLIEEKEINDSGQDFTSTRYDKPIGIDLSKNTLEVRQMIRCGIENLPKMAEIYPVGGAGDRLNLIDEKNKIPLPAAQLNFCGRTLLEGLIRDLQAKEYLYYKLTGQQLIIPILMMTSHEKNNHFHICTICDRQKWFGRPLESFRLFIQPMVPVITEEGNWAVLAPMKLILKPGGHGVIWKLIEEEGIFDELEARGKSKALLRQINNPTAGLDYGLLAFAGVGIKSDKSFGFASCPRQLNTSEGMNILIETKKDGGYDYHISNIEYTDFLQKGIKDIPESPGDPHSIFPANTNILFADLKASQKALEKCPIPGMLINMKNKVVCLNENGDKEEIKAGRLESLMQNLADGIIDHFPEQLQNDQADRLRTFVTYNDRHKTISVTKKAYISGQPIMETPEGCFYQLQKNYYELFTNFCHMKLPFVGTEEEYIAKGPRFLINFHPALGPLWSVIAQKIQGGEIKQDSDMNLEISELELLNLKLNGSLLIIAENVIGAKNPQGILQYNEKSGKCSLKNVSIHNKGIDRNEPNQFWKGHIHHSESFKIILKGNAEFYAENLTFTGNYHLEVPDGHCMFAYERNGKIEFQLDKIATQTWHWRYSFDEQENIILSK